ncbi:MAG: HPF/RaiA family ribosome-associated protein [Kofleriaceae bacterium]
MKLTIRTRHLEITPETSEEIRQRLYNAFARISPWIRAVDVTIVDINGPKGGADKQCRLRVRGRSIPSIVIEHVGVDTLATIATVAERAEQTVLRRVARRRVFAPLLTF